MDNLKFPYSYRELTEEENKYINLLKDYHKEEKTDCIRLVPINYTVRRRFLRYGADFYNFKPREDDIWLVGFPRSGTTLTQEILYILGTNFDYDKAASEIMDFRFPHLEHSNNMEEKELNFYDQLSRNENLSIEEEMSLPAHVRLPKAEGKRFIKSHLGFTLLHPQLLEVGCKVVFVARNIKDVFLSTFFYPLWNVAEEELQEKLNWMWLTFKNDLFFHANYFETLKEAWERRNSENLLILFYEDINKDKRVAIKTIADFIGVKITEEQLNKLLDHVDIKKFKNNPSLNNDHLVKLGLYVKNETCSFIRNGKSGGWRDIFPKKMNEEFDQWINTEIAKIPGFEMPPCWKEAMGLADV